MMDRMLEKNKISKVMRQKITGFGVLLSSAYPLFTSKGIAILQYSYVLLCPPKGNSELSTHN